MKLLTNAIGFAAVVFLSVALSGCNKAQNVDVIQRVVAIESADECHLCGMLISNFPGPKGEFYRRNEPHVNKFCSTRDLFAFMLQPENVNRISQVYVHDMAIAPWEAPGNEAFIDGKSAFYVVNHSRRGAMGPTLATFKQAADAQRFSEEFGGDVIAFSDINLDLLASLKPLAHMSH